jgi:hypothetical protein
VHSRHATIQPKPLDAAIAARDSARARKANEAAIDSANASITVPEAQRNEAERIAKLR